jgi:prevent-host-death family protein
METFTIRDLRERTGELIRDAEIGQLAIITKHGRPVFIALPFDETTMRSGVHVALAMKLFQSEVLSLGKAAKFANCSISEFSDHLAKAGIPSVNYSPDDLEKELKVLE